MLSQAEADGLIAMPKRFVGTGVPLIAALVPGCRHMYELESVTSEDRFILAFHRGRMRLTRHMMQTRTQKIHLLVRLDIDGAPHTNPDGAKMGRTHLHVYREGFEMRWARPIDPASFSDVTSAAVALADFLTFCHIELPQLQDVLL